MESGRGYDLNVSLFERLARSEYPCSTLTTQHRMHPDISQLIRPTYPGLLDSPKVSSRDPVRGLRPQTRIAFVNHNHKEGGDDDKNADDSSVSYTNEYEAQMVAHIVKYFQLNGYKNDQLVVLTPYLGQLRLIAEHIRGAAVSKKDEAELAKLDDGIKLPVPKPEHSVRVSSIDNYQVRVRGRQDSPLNSLFA